MQTETRNIAVLLTCFNRKDKTVMCLSKLYEAVIAYNSKNQQHQIDLETFLVDDGCTDGTADEVRSRFHSQKIQIIQGDGTLYWAGGMRRAWTEAYKRHQEWDFYLLLNDDTLVFPILFDELLGAHKFAIETFHKDGIYSGITRSAYSPFRMTYGGSVWINKFKGTLRRLVPNGYCQLCDVVNANVLLVSAAVVDEVGLLSEDYQHGLADYDYAIRVRKASFPVLLTASFCGTCENDHQSMNEIAAKIIGMSLSERMQYFRHPVHSNKDYLRFIRNTSPVRLPIVWVGRIINLYLPRLYYKLNSMRV